MLGQTEEAAMKKAAFEAEMQRRIPEEGEREMKWEELCEVSAEVALQTLGEKNKRAPKAVAKRQRK